jgi:hypothetical protein
MRGIFATQDISFLIQKHEIKYYLKSYLGRILLISGGFSSKSIPSLEPAFKGHPGSNRESKCCDGCQVRG